MSTFWQDLRYGWRMLMRSPGFTLVAVLTLALGIGANSAIFTVVNGILLRELPYHDPSRVVYVWDNFARLQMMQIPSTAAEYFDLRQQSHVFLELAAYRRRNLDMAGASGPERIAGASVSASLFPLLGVRALAGRTFVPEEDQAGRDNVVVLSYGFWQRRFGGDRNLVGQKLLLDSKAYTVVGIMPKGFQFPYATPNAVDPVALWAPIGFTAEELANRASVYNTSVVARLRPGVTAAQAQQEMDVIGRRLEMQYPQQYRGPRNTRAGWRITVAPVEEQITGRVRPALLMLVGAVGLLLLIACANVANLLLARAAARRREIAIREALGAGRLRLLRQFLTESVLLGALGGAAGLIVAAWGVDLLLRLHPAELPRLSEVVIDRRVILFTAAVSLLTGVIFGLLPLLARSRRDTGLALKEGRGTMGGISHHRARSVFVVSEIALSLVLLIGAGLLIRSFIRLVQVNAGFDPQNVLTMRIDLARARYSQPQQSSAFYRNLLDRLAALPGVEAASMISNLPLTRGGLDAPFSIEGRAYDPNRRPPVVDYRQIGDDYFRAMRIALVAGRAFNQHDAPDATRVVVVSESLSRSFFSGEDPIGQRIKLGGPNSPRPWLMIVGVAGDVRVRTLDSDPGMQMYVPYRQEPSNGMAVVLRGAASLASLSGAMPAAVHAIDHEQAVTQLRTMEDVLAESVAGRRFQMFLVGLFAAAGLLLAATGIYGVMAYSVTQRTQEIGIRMALGAERVDVLRLVLGEALGMAGAGVALGLAGALALTRFLRSLLYGVAANDPATFVGVPLGLIAVALLAGYLPARRASQLDPMAALRHE